MTANRISSTEFYLIDHWPGKVTNGPNPSDWATVYSAEKFDLGTKRMIYDVTNHGWSILMFLKFVEGGVAVSTVRDTCGMHTAAAASGHYYCVSDDADDVDLKGPIAICLGSPTTGSPYAWFWVGGVCPENAVDTLNDSGFVTDNSVTAQNYMVLVNASSFAVFHLATSTDNALFSAFSLVTDTTT